MWGIGISFGADFDCSAPNSPEPKKKKAPEPEPQPKQPRGYSFWDKMFFINDAYIPDPKHERTPETLAAYFAKHPLEKPAGF